MRVKFAVSFATLCCLLLASDTIAPLGKYTPAERRHWSFVKRSQPEIPRFQAAQDRGWVKTPVDAFLLARLKKEGLKPSLQADRATLIRRVTFDLTGLPATPAEVAAFVADRSPNAWEKLVDRLLASPHYGERWGQHWLDVVRFAESDGFEYDTHRRDAWRYRDYVIRAFQNDKPYDRFIQEQLAGDEITPAEDETLIASGFNRLAPLRKNAGNQEVASSRNEVLTEMTNIVGSALLGVTIGCARCHDHKFDPFRQSDYYRMQGFFASVYANDIIRATPAEQADWKTRNDKYSAEMKQLRSQMKGAQGNERALIQEKIEDLQDKIGAALPSLFSVKDEPEKRTEIHLLARGDYDKKGDRVSMRALGVLLPDNTAELPENTPKPRAELAKWVTDPENPLTARVMVNRLWHYHFGRGIVGTPNDFGRMGERPTHPDLLDYLANEFVSSGWSVKRIHKLILMSSAYRQASSDQNAAAREKDPDNKLLWHFSRQRLEAEEIRDAMLSVSGKLNEKAGGPSVIVPIDPDLVHALYKPSQWAVTADPAEHNRRSVYLFAKRNLHVPFLEVFDAPDGLVSCPRRESSTHAPQALEQMNGAFSNRMADAFAERLESEAGKDHVRIIDAAYRLAAGRAPNLKEKQLSLEFLKTQPLREFALAMFNLNAFLYVN